MRRRGKQLGSLGRRAALLMSLLACLGLAGACRINYELLDVTRDTSTGASAAVGGSPASGSGGVGGQPVTPQAGDSPGGTGTIEPTGGAPAAGGAGPGGECESSDDCASGACVANICEDVGLGAGTTVTFGNSDSDYNGVASDTYLDEGTPTGSFENYGFLLVRSTPSAIVSLIRFDISQLPAGATITGAQLALDTFHTPSTMGSVTVHEQLEPRTDWETTWNERALGVPWTAPGCGIGSRSADVLARFEPYEKLVYELPLPASVVQRWADDPSTNHGLVLVGDGSDVVDFRPSGVGSGLNPQLSISYQ